MLTSFAKRLVSISVAMASSGDFERAFSGPLVSTSCRAPLVAPTIGGTAADPAATRDGHLDLIDCCQSLTLLSWNLLATPYVRPDRESELDGLARAKRQIEYVATHSADIIGLQEFWHASEQLVRLWEEYARTAGYILHLCPRVDGKRDGNALLIRAALCTATPRFEAFHYNDWGSRVVQSATVDLVGGQSIVVLQTHLTFPHSSAHDPVMRRHQGRKLAELSRTLTGAACVFGDLNNPSEDDAALRCLTTLGGLRPMPPPRDEGDVISHVAHTGALMSCDLALTRGPCRIGQWSLGATREELVGRSLPSDHRPLHATILLGASAVEDEAGAEPEVW